MEGGVTVEKIKAHTSQSDVEAGRITVEGRAGDDAADLAAKRGAKLAEIMSPTGAMHGELARALRW